MKSNKKVLIVIGAVILLLIVIGLIIFLGKGKNGASGNNKELSSYIEKMKSLESYSVDFTLKTSSIDIRYLIDQNNTTNTSKITSINPTTNTTNYIAYYNYENKTDTFLSEDNSVFEDFYTDAKIGDIFDRLSEGTVSKDGDGYKVVIEKDKFVSYQKDNETNIAFFANDQENITSSDVTYNVKVDGDYITEITSNVEEFTITYKYSNYNNIKEMIIPGANEDNSVDYEWVDEYYNEHAPKTVEVTDNGVTEEVVEEPVEDTPEVEETPTE